MELRVIHQGEVIHTLAVADRPIHVGRSASNDLVFALIDVSGHHAVVYREAGAVWVKDLSSSNGTFVNGVACASASVVSVGDELRFGNTATVKTGPSGRSPAAAGLRLIRDDSGLSWPIGSVTRELPDQPGCALVWSDGELWLERDGDQQHPVECDESFQVDTVQYTVRRADQPVGATKRMLTNAHPYALRVDLDECRAQLVHRGTAARCQIVTENRVALLYALAQRWVADGEGSGRGWVDDDALAVAVWGRAHREQGSNNLHVLVHRIRVDVVAAGFERSFIEKRRGRTRIQVELAVTE